MRSPESGKLDAIGKTERLARAMLGAMQLVSSACCLLLAACADAGDPSASSSQSPEGTALRLGTVDVSAASIEHIAGWFAELEPGGSSTQHRRRAIAEHLLPQAAVRLALPEAAARAEAACVERRAELDREVLGPAPSQPDPARTVTGSWREVGLDVWSTARAGVPGEWSQPVAGIHHFLLARPWPGGEESRGIVRVELELFPIEGAAELDLESVLRSHALEVVDDDYLPAVPLLYREPTRSAP